MIVIFKSKIFCMFLKIFFLNYQIWPKICLKCVKNFLLKNNFKLYLLIAILFHHLAAWIFYESSKTLELRSTKNLFMIKFFLKFLKLFWLFIALFCALKQIFATKFSAYTVIKLNFSSSSNQELWSDWHAAKNLVYTLWVVRHLKGGCGTKI